MITCDAMITESIAAERSGTSFVPQALPTIDRAEAYLATGLVSEAAELFRAELEQHRSARAHLGLAHCAYRLQNLHEALGHLQAAAVVDPGFPNLANDTGVVLCELGLLDEARLQLERAIAQEPGDVQAIRNLLDVDAKRGDLASCARCCREILAIQPGDEEAAVLLDEIERRIAERTQAQAQP